MKEILRRIFCVLLSLMLLIPTISACQYNADGEGNSTFKVVFFEWFEKHDAEKYFPFSGMKTGMSADEMKEVTAESGWLQEELDEYILSGYGKDDADGIVPLNNKELTSENEKVQVLAYMKENSLDELSVQWTSVRKITTEEFISVNEEMLNLFSEKTGLNIDDALLASTIKEAYSPFNNTLISASGSNSDLLEAGFIKTTGEYRFWIDEEAGMGYALFSEHYIYPEGDGFDIEDPESYGGSSTHFRFCTFKLKSA